MANSLTNLTANNIRVIAGMTSLADDIDTKQEKHASTMVIHESYSSATNDNDIALIKLKDNLEFNDFVSPISIPSQEVLQGSTCVMTGWGSTSETGDAVDELHKVNLPVVERVLCRTLYGTAAITDGMICAGKLEGGVGSCYGDRGGPLQCNGSLHGISSWAKGCAEPSRPGVYTMVPYYKDWIEQYISCEM